MRPKGKRPSPPCIQRMFINLISKCNLLHGDECREFSSPTPSSKVARSVDQPEVDVLYDTLHTMGRNDIPVSLEDSCFSAEQSQLSFLLETTSSLRKFLCRETLGHANERANVLNIPSNEYAEFKMRLDPLAAKESSFKALEIMSGKS
ncbi:unnamed protein product [Dovyalis caffra]|uniref:Uncharacterized protein n=1 Tax=Dovyalis caffra TaxID=77055 RepID=A0AAV1RVU7_9ROSI|nr:unnamed protein product [Dovyalis caffra]